ncbi:MAG: hypothetical protein ACOVSR_06945 [Bacteroidia bacterium]
MDELNKRVCDVMERFCGSKSIFATELGVGLPVITHISSGRNKPGVDILQKILHAYPTIDATWLMIGKGEMIKTEKPSLNIDNEINNIKNLANKFELLKENTASVIGYHKLFMDELRHFTELDSILLKTQFGMNEIQQKIDEELLNLKYKVEK